MYSRNRGDNHHWFTSHSESIYEDLLVGLEIWLEREVMSVLAAINYPKHIRQELRENFLLTYGAALKQIYMRGVSDGMDREESLTPSPTESQAP